MGKWRTTAIQFLDSSNPEGVTMPCRELHTLNSAHKCTNQMHLSDSTLRWVMGPGEGTPHSLLTRSGWGRPNVLITPSLLGRLPVHLETGRQ